MTFKTANMQNVFDHYYFLFSFPEVMDNPNVSRWCFSKKDKNFSTGIEIANREPSS